MSNQPLAFPEDELSTLHLFFPEESHYFLADFVSLLREKEKKTMKISPEMEEIIKKSIAKTIENKNWEDILTIHHKLVFLHFSVIFLQEIECGVREREILKSLMIVLWPKNKIGPMEKGIIEEILKNFWLINVKTGYLYKDFELFLELIKVYNENSDLLVFPDERIKDFAVFLRDKIDDYEGNQLPNLISIITTFSKLNVSNLNYFLEGNPENPEGKNALLIKLCQSIHSQQLCSKTPLLSLSLLLKNIHLTLSARLCLPCHFRPFFLLTSNILLNIDPKCLTARQILHEILWLMKKSDQKADLFLDLANLIPTKPLEMPLISEVLGFFFETIEKNLLNSVFVPNIANFLTLTLKNLSFFDNKTQVHDFLRILLSKKEVFVIYLETQSFLKSFCEFTMNPQNIELFLVFLDIFYRTVLLEPDLEPFYRTSFFRHLDESLKILSPLDTDFNEKLLIFFAVFHKCLIFQTRIEESFVEVFEQPDHVFSLEGLFTNKKSAELALYFLTTRNFESLLELVSSSTKPNSFEIVTHIIQLTFVILTSNPDLLYYFKEHDLDQKLYYLLSRKLNFSNDSSINELIFLLNLLVNIATLGDFFFLVEKFLFFESPEKDHKKLEPQKKHRISSKNRKFGYPFPIEIREIVDKYSKDYADISKYIRVRIPVFLDLVVRFLYEIGEINPNIKIFYITLIKYIIATNLSQNAAFVANDRLVLRLLLALRLEKEESIREEITKTLNLILQTFISNHQLKAMFSLMLYSLPTQDFLDAFFEKEREYSLEKVDFMARRFSLHAGFLDALGNLIRLTKSLMKNSSDYVPKSSKFLGFSGLSSGIVFTNFRFPIKSFSINLEFTIDNLLTPQRSELPACYPGWQKNDPPKKMKTEPDPHMVSNKWPQKKFVDQQHFSISNKKSTKALTCSMGNEESSRGRKSYCPRLISLRSEDNSAVLEIFISDKRFLNIELKDKDKREVSDTFPLEFAENKLYNLLITYSQDKNFQVFEKEEEIKSNRQNFSNLLDKFQFPQYFAIGCAAESHGSRSHWIKRSIENQRLNFLKLEESLSGNIFSLKIIDKACTPSEIASQTFPKSINISLFQFIEKNNFPIPNAWLSLRKIDRAEQESQQIFAEIPEKPSFLGVILNKLHMGSDKQLKSLKNSDKPPNFDVKTRGVAYIDQTAFIEFFMRFANIEVFFFLVEALGSDADLGTIDNQNSQNTMRGIIEIMAEMVNKPEIDKFLLNGGFRILSFLLNLFIQKKGCSLQLFESILSFVNQFDNLQTKFQAFETLIFNFELYYTCEKQIQLRLLSVLESFLLSPSRPTSKDKKQIFYLFYSLNEFYTLEHHLKLIEKEKESACSLNLNKSLIDLVEIRNEILSLIEKIVQNSGELIGEFIELVMQNVFVFMNINCKNIMLSYTSSELLQAAQRILKGEEETNRKSKPKRHRPVDKQGSMFTRNTDFSASKDPPVRSNKSHSQIFESFKGRNKLKSHKYLLFSELLLQVLISLQETEKMKQYFGVRRIISQKFSERNELDSFISVVLALIFKCLADFEELARTSKQTLVKRPSNPSFSLLSISLEKSSEDRFKRGRVVITPTKILETLDKILPENLTPLAFTKLLDALEFSFTQRMNYEHLLVPIIWKRSDSLGLSKFLRSVHAMQKIDEESFFRSLGEIPNFVTFLISFNEKIENGFGLRSAEAINRYKTFVYEFLYFHISQDAGFKIIRMFILNSRSLRQSAIEQCLNVYQLLSEKFLLENSEKLKQNTEYLPIFSDFSEKTHRFLRNLIFFSYLLGSLGDCQFSNDQQVLYTSFLEKIFEIFEKIGILYSSTPEIPVQKQEFDFNALWAKLKKEVSNDENSLRPGGIFHFMIFALFGAINTSLGRNKLESQRLKLLELLSHLFFQKKSKKLFENSNKNFKKLFPTPTVDYQEVHSSPSSQKICEIFLLKLLESIDQQISMNGTQEDKFISRLILFLKEVIETTNNEGLKFGGNALAFPTFHSLMNTSKKFESSDALEIKEFSFEVYEKPTLNSESVEIKNKFLQFGRVFNQEFQSTKIKNQKPADPENETSEPGIDKEKIVRHSKSLEQNSDLKLDFFAHIKALLSNNFSDMISVCVSEFLRRREEITRIIKPILQLRSYREMNFVENIERFRLKIYEDVHQRENSRTPMNFEISLSVEEDLRRAIEKDTQRSVSEFLKKSKVLEEKEQVILMKSSRRWRYIRSQMLTPKGFWNSSTSSKKRIIYKIDKQTDSLNRRFFLRPIKDPDANLYLNHAKKQAMLESHKKQHYDYTPKGDAWIGDLMPIHEDPKEQTKESFFLIQDPFTSPSVLSSDNKSSVIQGLLPCSPSNVSKNYASLLDFTSGKSSQEDNFLKSDEFSLRRMMRTEVNRTSTESQLFEKRLLPLNVNKTLNLGPKKKRNNFRGPYKKLRDLRFSDVELRKFSNKEIEILESEFSGNQTQGSIAKGKYFAEMITINGAFYGLIELSHEDFTFRTLDSDRPDQGPSSPGLDLIEPEAGSELYKYFPLGTKKSNFIRIPIKKQWNFSEIIGAQGRSYNLRLSAFEVFTNDNKSHFFNVYSQEMAEKIIHELLKVKKNKLEFFFNRSIAFEASESKEKWIKGQISNFEYLMLLNKFAGRTYNDIHQYPVFPWILSDYHSDSLDFCNPKIYRDLSKPIGALNESRLKIYKDNYNTLSQIPDANIYTKPFFYGTHYSGIGPVLHFLIRLEPFATQHILLQSGSFDCPDRLFSSVPQAWRSCLDRDLKELTPEFFYLPDFLINKNGFDFGEGQSGDVVCDALLPKWAKNAYEFVFRNRQALESEYVSRNLNKWIDLIFGWKQTGKAAYDAYNVFGYLTYEENVADLNITDENEKKAVFEQIAEYGQTPHQILTKEHPTKENIRLDKIALIKSSDPNFRYSETIVEPGFPILKIAFSNNYQEISVYFNNNSVTFITLEEMALSFEPQSIKKSMHKEKIKTLQIQTKINANELVIGAHIYLFRTKKRSMIIGGLSDCSIKVFHKGKEVQQTEDFLHRKPISCISVSEKCRIIACGSKDCRISRWKYNKENIVLSPFSESSGLIYGHNNEIVTLKIEETLEILVSVDLDGVILLHEIRKGRFLRKIQVVLGRDEGINCLDIHENGLILVGSLEGRFLVYSLNGDLVNEIRIGHQMKIRYRSLSARFVSPWNSYVAIGDSEGDMLIYDAFLPELVNTFKSNPSENQGLTSLDVFDSEKSLSFIAGFDKGMIMLMNLLDQEKFTKHTLENKEKNMIFLKQLIDPDSN